MPAIEASQLTRVFDQKTAVDHLDLAVDEGEFFGFLGPNGAGKSTTIKMLVGLLRPTSGQARIAGLDIWQEPLKAKQLIGVLPEGLNLYERLTAREYVRFVGAMYGLPDREAARRTDELLDILDLENDADKMVVDFSQGMRKKTALAAAIMHTPRVLFLDEPFEGVDAISGRAIRNVLQRLRERGTTIFFSSHIMEVVERLCTRIAVITQGRLVAQGTMAELRALAQTGESGTLEDVFLRTVGATDEQILEETQRGLSWLE
ncbi:MAG: ABC transporter ATP-binding protein [Caldilinea sp.]|nr:ABC transporter ATP-binding protein [Caldilinea sp.]MCB0056947.1 ABC transporter ATP-binding protein [Caldilineaceae bacterium]MCB0039846.1 ABC transporter ATP-binding protein [Caldilinea sp.]MCB0134406.1 ABC transporter ATP-binding protein [Caldilineaceae bacterium]MCB0147583.1 ABC transporter ATP-binding protein [Caldilineaceae bacterium]